MKCIVGAVSFAVAFSCFLSIFAFPTFILALKFHSTANSSRII